MKIIIIFIITAVIVTIVLLNKKNNKNNNIKKQIQENYITNYDNIKDLYPDILPARFASYFDWASTYNQYDRICTTPVKDQGTCGCCWACVIATLLDSAYYRNTITYENKPPIIFSTQQIIDCLSKRNYIIADGCDGGYTIEAMNAYLGIRGKNMCTEDQYPFVSNKQIGSDDNAFLQWILKTFGNRTAYNFPGCQQDSSDHCKYNPIWFPPLEIITITPGNLTEDLLKKAIYWLGPLYIGCQVPFKFQIQGFIFKNYIYSGDLDKGGSHAMVLTGWGTTSTGKEYWIVQNSWGNSWGNNGFVWIKRDIEYIKKNIENLAAVKIQRNCVDISPTESSENSVVNIQIINAYQNIYPKVNNKNNPKNITVLEFKITVYIPVNNIIDSIVINIPILREKIVAHQGGLISTDNDIVNSYADQTIAINDENNYYYNKYGIVEEPKSYDWNKRWFVIRKKSAWYGNDFTSEWIIIVKIKDNFGIEANDSRASIDWQYDPVSISY